MTTFICLESAIWSGLNGNSPPLLYSVSAEAVWKLIYSHFSRLMLIPTGDLTCLLARPPVCKNSTLPRLPYYMVSGLAVNPEKECQWEPYDLWLSFRSHTTSTLLCSIYRHGHKILSTASWGNSEVPEELIRSEILLWPFLQNKVYHKM